MRTDPRPLSVLHVMLGTSEREDAGGEAQT